MKTCMRYFNLGTALFCLILVGPKATAQKPLTGPQLERALWQAAPGFTQAKPLKKRKLLLFTLTRGYFHQVIPTAAKALTIMGEKSSAFATVCTRDPRELRPERIKNYDAVCFLNTSGRVLRSEAAIKLENGITYYQELLKNLTALIASVGNPVQPAQQKFLRDLFPERQAGPLTRIEAAKLKQAQGQTIVRLESIQNQLKQTNQEKTLLDSLLNYINGGGGFIGIHAATDTHTENQRYLNLVGGCFRNHPWGANKTVAIKLDEPKNPINLAFKGAGFSLTEEIYQFKFPYTRDRMRVLLSLEMVGKKEKLTGIAGQRKDNDYAISWLRRQGKGRVFYCSLGHNVSTFLNRQVMRHYLAGIQFAFGDLVIKPRQQPVKEK